jgi:transposase
MQGWSARRLQAAGSATNKGSPKQAIGGYDRPSLNWPGLWHRDQPGSALSRCFAERLGKAGGRMRKVLIVALARKRLIALWRMATHGLVPAGSALKPA